jgi:hypothetical protein
MILVPLSLVKLPPQDRAQILLHNAVVSGRPAKQNKQHLILHNITLPYLMQYLLN